MPHLDDLIAMFRTRKAARAAHGPPAGASVHQFGVDHQHPQEHARSAETTDLCWGQASIRCLDDAGENASSVSEEDVSGLFSSPEEASDDSTTSGFSSWADAGKGTCPVPGEDAVSTSAAPEASVPAAIEEVDHGTKSLLMI